MPLSAAGAHTFTSVTPKFTPHGSFLAGEVGELAGVTGNTIGQWARRGLIRSSQSDGEPRLTSREWEVLELMRRKMTTAQIARTLVVSPATVRSHVAAILRKLRVTDREAAVRLLDPEG